MDADYLIPASEAEVGNDNHHASHFQEEEIIVARVAECSNVILEATLDSFNKLGIVELIAAIEHSSIHEKGNCLTVTGPVDMKETNKVHTSKPQNGLVKEKTKNILSSKAATFPKKNGFPKVKTTSNGTVSAASHPKQPMVKSRQLNDGHVNINPAKTKTTLLAITNSSKSKPVKLESATSPENMVQTESFLEKTKLRPLKRRPLSKTEEESETTESNSSADVKRDRVGKLPSYSFSFRCDKRAQRRKEFYSKLEEKIHAKEVEKTNLQAKSKETQVAEIKMLRKSLTFKATPMPSFYQEPAPAKVELRKIPVTHPRSPKLGRNKSFTAEDGRESNRVRPGQLSLDQRISQNKLTKVPSLAYVKKPPRRSLPRLPAEKTSSPKAVEAAGPTAVAPVQEIATLGDTLIKEVEDAIPADEPSQTQSIRHDVPVI